ncbi:MAG TPA: prolyl oligopeptidase family serine peptidase, partial [Bacteroidota bacterium]
SSRGWLTVEAIMRDVKWMGTSPSGVFWSEDGKKAYFEWRREGDLGDSLYEVSASGGVPKRVPFEQRRRLPSRTGEYTKDRKRKIYIRDNDIFVLDISRAREVQLTRTVDSESNPRFSFDEQSIIFERDRNLFKRELSTGLEEQLTNFVEGANPGDGKKTDLQEYVGKEALELSLVLQERKKTKAQQEKEQGALARKHPKKYYAGQKSTSGLRLSPDERFVTFVLTQQANDARRTAVPNYVTESGFTEDLTVRTKVGEPLATQELAIYDCVLDTVRIVKPDALPGVLLPAKDSTKEQLRPVRYTSVVWSDDGKLAFPQVFSQDNKDRWIVMLKPEDAAFGVVLDHQHDDAWIGGPGIGFFGGNTVGWMPDSRRVYFHSEADGWSHLYVVGIDGKGRKQLTRGKFEIYDVSLSRDKKKWYFSSNELHYGERHFYSMPLEGGSRTKLTTMQGRSDVEISPDEERLAFLHSFSNTMPELYLMDNRPAAKGVKVTDSPSKEFRAYNWRAPEITTIRARDGAPVPVRVYKPDKPNGAAVIFVHGAGYLQNAHKWWSSYFREYMFHNLLADKGYTVLDADYRASAGLGRDWRTAIYRHMGGKDLEDQVDAARWLVETHEIDSSRIGIYGGSYGGFITLMAMFTTPGVFAAGAALRPVTDWAHYNHGYTSAILNIPQEDSVAFRRSSPIYYAEGFRGALLICHGMIDVNVHFQDAVRLVQRLIELKKENWELAVYPLEDHGFKEESSWMDEYKRILKLFDQKLVKGPTTP